MSTNSIHDQIDHPVLYEDFKGQKFLDGTVRANRKEKEEIVGKGRKMRGQ